MFDNRSPLVTDCFRRLESLDQKRIFYWYRKYFSKLSELVSYLHHVGFDMFLIRGVLLTAYRDRQYKHHYDLFTCFGIHDEKPWVDNDSNALHFFATVCNFIGDDPELGFYWSRDFEIPRHVEPDAVNAQSCSDVGVLLFNVMLNEFPEFPFQRIEIQRHFSSDVALLEIFPDLENRVIPMLQHLDDDLERATFCYPKAIDLKWLRRKSLVYMYESPFWTIDERFIEDYLIRSYGDNWEIPESHAEKPQNPR